jgi:hypothetical protein
MSEPSCQPVLPSGSTLGQILWTYFNGTPITTRVMIDRPTTVASTR